MNKQLIRTSLLNSCKVGFALPVQKQPYLSTLARRSGVEGVGKTSLPCRASSSSTGQMEKEKGKGKGMLLHQTRLGCPGTC